LNGHVTPSKADRRRPTSAVDLSRKRVKRVGLEPPIAYQNGAALVVASYKGSSVVGNQIGSDGIEDGSNCLSGIRRLVGARGGQQEDGSQETGEVGSHHSLQVWTVVESAA